MRMLGHVTECMTLCVDGHLHDCVCVNMNVRDIWKNVWGMLLVWPT